jgi:hypothetical protein
MVMDKIYVRSATILKPAPPHNLLFIDNVCKVAPIVELIKPDIPLTSFSMYLLPPTVGWGNVGHGRGIEPSHDGTRSNNSQRSLYPSYTNPIGKESIGFAQLLITCLDLLLRREGHYETVEVTLWSLDSTTASRIMSDGYFIPGPDGEIDEIAGFSSL